MKNIAAAYYLSLLLAFISPSSALGTAAAVTGGGGCVGYGPAALEACGEISMAETGGDGSTTITVADLAKHCEDARNTEWAWCLANSAIINAGIVSTDDDIKNSFLSEVDACLEKFACSCKAEERVLSSRQSNCEEVTPQPSLCFSELATVEVLGKGAVEMKDLKVGDLVRSGYDPNRYQKVYAFAHRQDDRRTEFLKIKTNNTSQAAPLEITSDHLVFVDGKSNPVRAGSIKIGDILQAEQPSGAKVIEISNVSRKGLYAPLTQDGTLIIDGVRASSYVSLQENADEYVQLQGGLSAMSQHDLIHLALSPFRIMCMGVSKQLCQSLGDDGMPRYVSRGIQLAKWLDSMNLNIILQIFLLTLVVSISSCFMFLEAQIAGFGILFAILGVYFLLRIEREVSLKQKGSFALVAMVLALLPIRSIMGLCGADGPRVLAACGDTAILTDPPTTLYDLSAIGNCEHHRQGLVSWFHCINVAALDSGISNVDSSDWELVRNCVADAWSCPSACNSPERGRVLEDLCPTPPPTSPPPTECFSESTTVQVFNKGTLPMKDLQVGDKILNSVNQYEIVYAFGHYQPNHETEYLKIETDQKKSLELKAEHLLYRKGSTYPVSAASVEIGDKLMSSNGAPTQTVTKISSIVRRGIYAPLTSSGSFLADGVKVSSYAAIQPKRSDDDTGEYAQLQDGTKFMPQHIAIHLFLAPFRLHCQLFQVCDSYNDNGVPRYISVGIDFFRWLDEQSMLFQVVMFVPGLFVFGTFAAAEQVIFGHSMVAAAAAVFVGLSLLRVFRSTSPKSTMKVKTS